MGSILMLSLQRAAWPWLVVHRNPLMLPEPWARAEHPRGIWERCASTSGKQGGEVWKKAARRVSRIAKKSEDEKLPHCLHRARANQCFPPCFAGHGFGQKSDEASFMHEKGQLKKKYRASVRKKKNRARLMGSGHC